MSFNHGGFVKKFEIKFEPCESKKLEALSRRLISYAKKLLEHTSTLVSCYYLMPTDDTTLGVSIMPLTATYRLCLDYRDLWLLNNEPVNSQELKILSEDLLNMAKMLGRVKGVIVKMDYIYDEPTTKEVYKLKEKLLKGDL